MPPKRILVERAGASRTKVSKGYLRSTYDALTSPENASVVRSIAIFGVAVGFLTSPWAEWLLSPQ